MSVCVWREGSTPHGCPNTQRGARKKTSEVFCSQRSRPCSPLALSFPVSPPGVSAPIHPETLPPSLLIASHTHTHTHVQTRLRAMSTDASFTIIDDALTHNMTLALLGLEYVKSSRLNNVTPRYIGLREVPGAQSLVAVLGVCARGDAARPGHRLPLDSAMDAFACCVKCGALVANMHGSAVGAVKGEPTTDGWVCFNKRRGLSPPPLPGDPSRPRFGAFDDVERCSRRASAGGAGAVDSPARPSPDARARDRSGLRHATRRHPPRCRRLPRSQHGAWVPWACSGAAPLDRRDRVLWRVRRDGDDDDSRCAASPSQRKPHGECRRCAGRRQPGDGVDLQQLQASLWLKAGAPRVGVPLRVKVTCQVAC